MANKSMHKIGGDEEVMVICSPEAHKIITESGYCGLAAIAPWVDDTSCIIVRQDDWEELIDKGEMWILNEEKQTEGH